MNDAQFTKSVRVDIPSVGNKSYPGLVFNQEEERLLSLVRNYYPLSPLWETEPLLKMAALIDIYGGFFPAQFPRTLALVLLASHELVAFCRLTWRPLPKTQCNNSILDIYREEREEQCDRFASYTRQLFFRAEQTLQMRELELLSSPEPASYKKCKKSNY